MALAAGRDEQRSRDRKLMKERQQNEKDNQEVDDVETPSPTILFTM